MMVPWDETDYKTFMDTEVRNFLATKVREGQFESFDGARLQYYYAVQPGARAAVVMVHGFTEFFGKFHEVFYNFFDQRYDVFFIEQRGHGLSHRDVENKQLVHIDSFETYVEDLKSFIDQVVLENAPDLPLLLYAHSMGGCVSALFLEEHAGYFKAALLSSPMLKMYYGDVKVWQADLLAKTSRVLGWETRPLPNFSPFDPEHPDFEHSSGLSRARFDYAFHLKLANENYQTSGGTYGWCVSGMDACTRLIDDAYKVKIPVLICQAGRDTMVDNEGQNIFARHAKNCTIRRFPDSRHEIYNSTGPMLRDYEDTVVGFYDRVLQS